MRVSFLPVILATASAMASAVEITEFQNPAASWRPRPLWFWNDPVNTPDMVDQLTHLATDDGYGGVAILPFQNSFAPKYLSDEYFAVYAAAAARSKELGLTMCLYDEYGFPSGSAGAGYGDGIPRFANAFPDDTIKRLDKTESTFKGPGTFTAPVPSGTLMACVAMNTATLERIDLTPATSGDTTLTWNAPAGNWKVMFFNCVKDGDPDVDYLSPESCDKFISLVHQNYYDHLSSYFGEGKVIDTIFFDEITIYRGQGRMWTPSFNRRFTEKYGSSPALLYPALWYDIGDGTASARSRLFGMRAELYATGYPKRLQDWARAHGGVHLTGHQDQEEAANPSGVSGDLMKCFKYQDIPGIDKVGGDRPTGKFYKVVSSSAFNWDKPRVMSETYGAMGNIPWDTIQDIAMDQYTKGISMMVPHGAWYNPGHVYFPPELSYRNPLYSSGLHRFTTFIGRLNVMLQGGRHVADIGILYPISGLHGGHRFDGPAGFYEGGVIIPGTDYAEVGRLLSDDLCQDYTFLHPEVIDEKCSVEGARFKLNNPVNFEQYPVIIIPGGETIQWSNLRKIREFYDHGGKVIATTLLPSKSAEPGHDAEVVSAIAAMFPDARPYPHASASSTWATGGHEPNFLNDGLPSTRWNAAAKTGPGEWIQIDFGSPRTFVKTITRETFDRTKAYEIQYWNGAAWTPCFAGTTLGPCKTDEFPAVTSTKVRLLFKEGDLPSIDEFEVYDQTGTNIATGGHPVTHGNPAGGKTWFLSVPTAANLREALDDALKVPDLRIESGASIQNIHKVKDGRHIWYLANRSGSPVDTWVRLRGRHAPQTWDPMSGEASAVLSSAEVEDGLPVTRVKLTLPANKSLFLVTPPDTGSPPPTPSR